MSSILKKYISLFVALLIILPGFGQVIEKIEEFESEKGTPIKLGYLEATQTKDLKSLRLRLPPETFPLVIIKKSDFASNIGLIRKLQIQSLEYAQLSRELAYQDSLNTLRDQVFYEIIQAERQRGDLHKQTNEQLNVEINRLSNQIDKTLDIGERSLKGRNFKLLTTGLLGAAIGLTTGLLVGVLIEQGVD